MTMTTTLLPTEILSTEGEEERVFGQTHVSGVVVLSISLSAACRYMRARPRSKVK